MAVSVAMPSSVSASSMIELIDNNDLQKVVITINDNVLHVSGGAGMTMAVYNVAGGAPVMKVKVDGQDKRYDLDLPKGIYIVQVGKTVRKIVIK